MSSSELPPPHLNDPNVESSKGSDRKCISLSQIGQSFSAFVNISTRFFKWSGKWLYSFLEFFLTCVGIFFILGLIFTPSMMIAFSKTAMNNLVDRIVQENTRIAIEEFPKAYEVCQCQLSNWSKEVDYEKSIERTIDVEVTFFCNSGTSASKSKFIGTPVYRNDTVQDCLRPLIPEKVVYFGDKEAYIQDATTRPHWNDVSGGLLAVFSVGVILLILQILFLLSQIG